MLFTYITTTIPKSQYYYTHVAARLSSSQVLKSLRTFKLRPPQSHNMTPISRGFITQFFKWTFHTCKSFHTNVFVFICACACAWVTASPVATMQACVYANPRKEVAMDESMKRHANNWVCRMTPQPRFLRSECRYQLPSFIRQPGLHRKPVQRAAGTVKQPNFWTC